MIDRVSSICGMWRLQVRNFHVIFGPHKPHTSTSGCSKSSAQRSEQEQWQWEARPARPIVVVGLPPPTHTLQQYISTTGMLTALTVTLSSPALVVARSHARALLRARSKPQPCCWPHLFLPLSPPVSNLFLPLPLLTSNLLTWRNVCCAPPGGGRTCIYNLYNY